MQLKENIDKIKDFVEEVLKEDERARNNDHWLIILTLQKMGFKIYIDYNMLEFMPSFETITRCRREIQNTENRLLPTEEVEVKRNNHRIEMQTKYSPKSRINEMKNSQFSPDF